MVSKSLVKAASLCLPIVLAPFAVHADVVTLYLPDTSPAAFSADVLGTDGAGRTTWRLSPGQPSGTLPVINFPVATLVEGPKDVHAVAEQNGVAAIQDCTIDDGVAVCTGVRSAAGSMSTVAVTTETVSQKALPVQVTGVPGAENGAVAVGFGAVGLGLGGMGFIVGVVGGLVW